MGGAPSSLNFSNVSGVAHENNEIFETGYDDLPLTKEFQSQLFKEDPASVVKKINFPEDSLVASILTNPLVYTQVTSQQEAWLNIIIPLFKGNPNSSPYSLQLLTSYFKFLNDRSLSTMKQEEAKRNMDIENRNLERRNMLRTFSIHMHMRHDIATLEFHDYHNINDVISTIHQNEKKNGEFSFLPNILYRNVTDFVVKQLSDTTNPQDLFNAVEWSLFSSDITSLISTFTASFRFLNNKQNCQPVAAKYSDFLDKIPVVNSILVPDSQSLIGSCTIPKYQISSHGTTSSIACDGNFIYILGSHSTIHQVSLSKLISNNSNRFSTKELKIEKRERIELSLTSSNGFLILSGPFLVKQKLLRTAPLEVLDKPLKKTSGKFSIPFTSDGYFIYSLSKNKVNIFSIQNQQLVLNRTLKLQSNPNSNLSEAFSKKLIPKTLNNVILISNGIVLTAIKPSSKNQYTNGRYNYAVRHFSLLDGMHIIDSDLHLKTPIISMCFDPWNKCIWGLAPAENKNASLLKFKLQGSLPLWLTGVDYSQIPLRKDVSNFVQTKNVVTLSHSIIDFISYFISHFVGSDFNSSIHNNPDQLCSVPRFFAPGSLQCIDEIVSALEFLELKIRNSDFKNTWDLKSVQKAMITLFYLLDFNLSNLNSQSTDNTIKLPNPKLILDLMSTLYKDSKYSFLNFAISFTFINSFDVLLTDKTANPEPFFTYLLDSLNPSSILFMIIQLSKSPMFPYCFSTASCRKIFAPILKRMTTSTNELNRNHFELVNAFLRSTIYELFQAYKASTGSLTKEQKNLQDTFQTFSGIITEEMICLLRMLGKEISIQMLPLQPFIRIFQKWMLLLHSFVQFSRMSCNIVSLLQPLFTQMSISIADLHIEKSYTEKGFVYIYSLFYDLFSLYLDFISALIDGGTELKDIQQYTWLIKSTLFSKLTIEKVNELTEQFDQPLIRPNSLLKKGFSFNSMAKYEQDDQTINDFIEAFIAHEEKPIIKQSMDYIYMKVNNPTNKRLTPEDRHQERILFAVFMKHLGFAITTRDLTLEIAANQKPILNHYIKQCISSIYKIRSQLKSCKQEYMRETEEARESGQTFQPQKLRDDFPKYQAEIRKKCIFLLHIQPCNRFRTDENEDVFSDMMKHITNFILSNDTLESYFHLLQDSFEIQKNVATGLGLINSVLQFNYNQICSSCMIERFASSNSISTYLMAISDTPNMTAIETPGFKSIMTLMNYVRQLILSDSKEYQKNSLLVFFANLIYSLSVVAPEQSFDPLADLINQIFAQQVSFTPKVFSSFISFIVSTICLIFEKNPSMLNSPHFKDLCSIFVPYREFANQNLSVGMLFYRSGIYSDQNPLQIFQMFSSANPDQFESISYFIYELISKQKEKSLVLLPIFQEISKVCIGESSLILNKRNKIGEIHEDNENAVTPEIILAGVCACIQLIRRFLQEKDEEVQSIISYILRLNCPEVVQEINNSNNTNFVGYGDHKMLFAVFAILSNVIEQLHFGSILKSDSSNQIYIVSGYDNTEQKLQVWQLPLNNLSEEQHISLYSDLHSVPLIPFQPQLYQNYKYLIPYFRKYFNQTKSFLSESLSYYVLSCLNEYLSVPEVIKELPSILSKQASLNRLCFVETNINFLRILKSHLSNKNNGFGKLISENLAFDLISPTTIHLSNYFITSSSIKIINSSYNSSSYYLFATQCLSENKTTYMTIRLTLGSESCFNIGLYSPNIINKLGYQALAIQVEPRYKVSAQSNLSSQRIPIRGSPIFVFQYDPTIHLASIYDDKDCLILSHKFDTNTPFFFIEVQKDINVEFQFIKNTTINTAKSVDKKFKNNALYVFDYKNLQYSIDAKSQNNTLPLCGKSTFQRNKKRPTIDISKYLNDDEDESNVKNNKEFISQLKYPIDLDSHVDIKLSEYRTNFASMDHNQPCINEEHIKYIQNLKIPQDVINRASSSLNISSTARYNFEYFSPTYDNYVYSSQAENMSLNSGLTSAQTNLGNYIYYNIDHRYVNPLTGEISNISGFQTTQMKTLPTIHPSDLEYMPSNISNYFLTGYTQLLRKSLVTKSYLKQLASPIAQINFGDILKAYHINNDMNLLAEHFIELLTLCEPINDEDHLIDFSINILDSGYNAPPYLTTIHQACLAIFEYIQKDKDTLSSFLDAYADIVNKRISNKYWHYIVSDHPYAIHVRASTRINLPKEYVRKWLAFNFSQSEVIGKFDSFSGEVSKEMIYIPLFKDDNSSLLGTFIELYIGFKYFVHISKIDSQYEVKYRPQIYTHYIDCILSKSPLMTNETVPFLQFLQKQMPTTGTDIKGDFLIRLNILGTLNRTNPPAVAQFLEDQQNLWDERVLMPLKKHFPEFLTQADIESLKSIPDEPLRLPSEQFPKELRNGPQIKTATNIVKRTLLPRTSIIGFPFHFVLTIWTEYSILYPPNSSTISNDKHTLSIQFHSYVPSKICIRTKALSPFKLQLVDNLEKQEGEEFESNSILTRGRKTIYLYSKDHDWAHDPFVIQAISNDISADSYIEKYRDRFITDVTNLSVHWSVSNDQKLLSILGYNSYTCTPLKLTIDPTIFINSNFSDEISILLVRSKFLLILNWLVFTSNINLESDPSLLFLNPMIAAPLKLKKFQTLVRDNSVVGRASLTINRKGAFDVREGLSHNLSQTIVAQIAKAYTPNRDYKENSDRPWHVEFINERGIDAGGLARELVSECAYDLVSPNCGLVIPVPNNRNEVGSNRDLVIPFPNPQSPYPEKQYRFAGAFIGICIRTGIVQELNFAPLVWEYLITGKFSIDMLFDIDQNYKILIESLQEAMKTHMDDATFRRQFNLKFVVYNSAGIECPLTANGRSEEVTISNVSLFISMANEFRQKELTPYLEMMRTGLWENLNIKPLQSLDWPTLEFAACGEKEITFEAFRDIVTFREEIPSDQRQMFFNVLRRFTSEERGALLKFATGRIRLPPKGSPNTFKFKIDSSSATDILPTASTCFYALHMPRYSSEDKMYQLIRAAAVFTGSIENS